MHKDKLTGNEIVDIDFLGKKLFPPKKLKQTDAGREMEKLLRELDKCIRPGRKTYKKEYHSGTSRGRGERLQPCMVKMFYTKDKIAHKEFLRNYMKQENKKEVIDKPVLFNGIYDEVPEEVLMNYEQNEMVDLGFKFIISPESQKIPMKQLVRQFVHDLEMATGYKFTWFSAVHTDTGHTHAHLLINGVDRKTKQEIHFSKMMIKEIARTMGSRICTRLVGERSEEQIELARKNLPNAKRWTILDERLSSSAGYDNFVKPVIEDECEYEAQKVTSDDIEIQRLNALTSMGLAKVKAKGNLYKYYLEKGWKNKLRAIGRYNTYLDARTKLRFTPYYNLEVYDGNMGKIEGFISQVYNMDEEYIWNNAIVIENKKLNKAWYVPTKIKLKPDDIGKVITVKAEKNQKGILRPLITIHSY